jgi:hypothetical protein
MKKIEKRIETFATYDVPDVLSKIMPETEKAFKFRFKPAFTFALSFLLIGLLSLPFFLPAQDIEASSIYLDFDTAIKLSLNEKDEIIDIEGLNMDGETLVALLKAHPAWQKESFDVFLPRLLETLQTSATLPDHRALLYSVQSDNPSTLARLQGQLQRQLNASENPVFDDLAEGDHPVPDTEEITSANPLRQRLINQILEKDATYDAAELQQIPLNELIRIGRELGITQGRRP